MMFCPKCRSLMSFDSKRRVYRCSRCGYEVIPNNNSRAIVSRTIEHKEKEKLVVIEGTSVSVPPNAVLVKGHTRCPKCGSEEVYAWQMQTRAADEPPTTFYKCPSCGHTWREY
ncbi:transcription termination factor Tfs [Ignisphaera aggregans DSM 17230]|uniref:Transcription termination factor Tfs n=1 Tax=Ignisphaera aggregans (strain DSM 17230 / JCM 13409 / AQ1.S1) TaxID=583356 RepID=E0SRH1_IGNAA|nr:transcription termination factor Tfs [Ignisphaera aggregans DSM 17230]